MVDNPFTPATLFCDYMFGHPFNGGKNVGSNVKNKFIIDWTATRNGYAHLNDHNKPNRTWDDKVVGHYDPPMSTTRWNTGSKPGVDNAIFAEYYSDMIIGNGAVSFGIPLNSRYNFESQFLCRDWAIIQLELLDDYLNVNQFPGAPNWARQRTILPDAISGIPYTHTLVEGTDFWDPEGDTITSLKSTENSPAWLTILETEPGVWTLSGRPNETINKEYEFNLVVSDASGRTSRLVSMKVNVN